MSPEQLLDFQLRAAMNAADLQKRLVDDHLIASEQIEGRKVNQGISQLALEIAKNPTSSGS